MPGQSLPRAPARNLVAGNRQRVNPEGELMRSISAGRVTYPEARARYLDGARRFVEGARSQKSTFEAPEPAP